MRACVPLLLVMTLAALHLGLIPPVQAQPTWSFRLELLPSDLYMGEWGVIRINLTNMDCSARIQEEVFEFDDIPDYALNAIIERAEEMWEEDLIKGFDVSISYSHGYGGMIYHDAELKIFGACSGKAIKIYYAFLWFPWESYSGKEFGSKSDMNLELEAFNPIDYILQGHSPGSSTIVEFDVFIPPDILPEERTLKPAVDFRVHYPGWLDYTLENYQPIGSFEINPYRSFNLTIATHDGVEPIAGARVVIRRLIHYYEVREYVTPENGTIRIGRLREGDYEIRVYWNSSLFAQESPLIHLGDYSAYDLAASKALKTQVFNVRVDVLDLRGRRLNGSITFLDGVKRVAENGVAVYKLVPNGNHTLQAYWMGEKLYDEWIWIGYHPTIAPEPKKPHYELVLPVDDLVVQAVDSGGNPVGASFELTDPEGRIPAVEKYSRTGFLNVSRLPAREYLVKAVNCSEVFGSCAEASGAFKPGSRNLLEIPIHSAAFRIYSMDQRPLGNATVIFGPLEVKANDSGMVAFAGIPAGAYPLKVFWRGVEVYSDRVNVDRSIVEDVLARVYDVRLRLRTADDKAIRVWWILVDPLGAVHTPQAPSDLITLELVPDGECNLTILWEENLTIVERRLAVAELAEMSSLKLPVGRLTLKFVWEDGSPIAEAPVLLKRLLDNRSYESVADQEGKAWFEDMLFGDYYLRVNYPGAKFAIISRNVTFSGDVITVEVKRSQISVKVVDFLGNPVEGARVKVSMSGAVFREESTGASGILTFTKLPPMPTYRVDARYGSARAWGYAYPGQLLVIKLDVIRLPGFMIQISALASMMPYLAALIAVLVIILVARRLVAKRRRSGELLQSLHDPYA